MLEPGAGKLARPVLKGPRRSNASGLPDRDLRPAKTQLKISCCHRSTTGATAWLRVRGYISTARKHGINVMTAIRDAVTGNPWTPQAALQT